MPAIYEHVFTVPESAIDGQGHVGNVEYVRWMQDAAVAHSRAQGWSSARYRDLGAGWVVREHRITYLRPAFAGEEITVYTWIADFRAIRSLRKYKMVRSGDSEVLAEAETDWAFIGLEHRVPRRVPKEVSEAFVIVTPEQEPQFSPSALKR